jgi:23S rRNA (uridine2552-2'-O)-methyltransferase
MKKPDYSKPDHFSRKARERGFPARSVFKLEELDERFHLLKPGMRVLDLGAAPGSWMKYCALKVGASGLVLGIDRSRVDRAMGANEVFIQSDIFMVEPAKLCNEYRAFDLALSDLAPDLSGNKYADSVKSTALCERAFQFAKMLLKPGGAFLVKAFQGDGFDEFCKALGAGFRSVNATKPKSSRPNSREMYVYCRGFGGSQSGPGKEKRQEKEK